ncbi:MAG: UDP-N-acetylglucosamine 2-epimerase (non-hydrolyzing) [Planctomycetota bacterium]|jgi:UDP-N-acetylglucosamine 2-epimerase (non-hydrolysing)|nr:MAG: UDP-N-acetylglucosamine 2-epimerase (non-hydrolyzing) [Planctomycetota bacterium]
MIHLCCVVGARPNFMKMAPLLRAMDADADFQATLVHTGQHYDPSLSDVFFQELGMRAPDVHLNVGSGKQGEQTARILEGMEKVLEAGPGGGAKFDRLIVVGDVNSTMAASLAAAKLCIPIAHVEAGLRSGDRTMPEEINRLVTDAISDLLLVSEPSGIENLKREGHPDDHIVHVGNIMIDTLNVQLPLARGRSILKEHGLTPGQYGVVTLHRPANVDEKDSLSKLIEVFSEVSQRMPLIFPIHPRTRARIESFGLNSQLEAAPQLRLTPPLGYLDFLALTSQAKVIVTDSGGLQEESTVLGVPCLTMRPNTERPTTVTVGTSTLIGSDFKLLREEFQKVLGGQYKRGRIPDFWDGQTAGRVMLALRKCHGLPSRG